MEPLDDKNTAQLLQQMRRQTEIRPEQEESSVVPVVLIPGLSESVLLWPEYYCLQ